MDVPLRDRLKRGQVHLLCERWLGGRLQINGASAVVLKKVVMALIDSLRDVLRDMGNIDSDWRATSSAAPYTRESKF